MVGSWDGELELRFLVGFGMDHEVWEINCADFAFVKLISSLVLHLRFGTKHWDVYCLVIKYIIQIHLPEFTVISIVSIPMSFHDIVAYPRCVCMCAITYLQCDRYQLVIGNVLIVPL